jgi:protoporphyrinogen/coproporphyrinogen III oxidase
VTRVVAVAGGGITGLVAARELGRAGHDVVLLEAGGRLGGKIRTRALTGALVEDGPDWFVTTQPAALHLCRELGLGADLVEPAVAGAKVWADGRLWSLPAPNVRGVPASARAALSASALPYGARLRALAGLLWPGRLTGPDISVGSFVRKRFGPRVLDRFVDPMLAASRSGRPDELSLGAAAREIDSAARAGRGLMMTLGHTAGSASFVGILGGMERLADELWKSLPSTDVRLDTAVESVERAGTGYRIATAHGLVRADAVVVALPAYAAAAVLSRMDEALAQSLARIEYSSCAVATFVYPPGSPDPPRGVSGVLVPSSEGMLMTACAWFSTKWPHARPPDGGPVIRCFAGRRPADPALDLDDDLLTARLAAEVGEVAGLGSPSAHTLARWDRALPVYAVGHPNLVWAVQDSAAHHPGLAIAVSGLSGSGLPDCIAAGGAAARLAGMVNE